MAQPGILQLFLEIVKEAINRMWTCRDFFLMEPRTYATIFQAHWAFHSNQGKLAYSFHLYLSHYKPLPGDKQWSELIPLYSLSNFIVMV